MTAVLRFIIPVLIVVAIATAAFFLLRANSRRHESSSAAYNVGRQEARVAMQLNILRALAVVILGALLLILFSVARLFIGPQTAEEPSIEPTATLFVQTPLAATPTTDVATPALVATSSPDSELPTLTAVPATPVATAVPSATPTLAPEQATVSSGVGVWLRSAPSVDGEQLEWLLDGTVLTLLDGQQVDEAFTWQEVQTSTGTSGWVASEFIVINTP